MTESLARFRSHPPMRPLPELSARPMTHGRAFFVDPKTGTDTAAGSEKSPWKTIGHALHQIRAGDTLYLRGGVYYEQVRIALRGKPDAPITIRSYPNELAIIDGGLAEFFQSPTTAWEPLAGDVPDYFRSVHAYPNERAMLGWFGDSLVPLLTYQHPVDIEERSRVHFETRSDTPSPLPVYFGPGIWYDVESGHVHARLTHTDYQFDYPGTADYRGVRDPRQVPFVIAPLSAVPLELDGAEHLTLQDIVIRGGGENTVVLHDCQWVTFDNVVVYCGTYGLRSRSSGPVRFLHSALRGSIPPWFVHTAGSLRNIPGLRARHDPASGRATGRDITRLNTHVLAAIEGRTEEMVDYAFPGNHHWEFAHSDFTDGFDGIHFGGECVEFHHNRVDRFFDDAIYLTPLTPGYLDQVHIYQNLFTRCFAPFGFGGLSGPGGPVYIYRNVIDCRAKTPASHGKWFSNLPLVGHFRSREEFNFGQLYLYQNTIVSPMGPAIGQALTQDVRRPYGLSLLAFTRKNLPRRVFNNLLVHLEGMVPPTAQSMPLLDEDVAIDGNAHFDLVNLEASAAKLAAYQQSAFFQQTRHQHAPGWEAQARVGDPRFVRFQKSPWAINDYRLGEGSVAISAGVALSAALPDPVRSAMGNSTDAGALPFGAEPLRVGRESRPGDAAIYYWLEREEIANRSDVEPTSVRLLPSMAVHVRSRTEVGSTITEPAGTAALRGSSIEHLKSNGFCVIENVIPADATLACYYDAFRILTTCGVIAANYAHNVSWQRRALELLDGVIDPARADSVLNEQFYIRPAAINDMQSFAPYLADPRVMESIATVLGLQARALSTTLYVHEPGTQRGPWHAGGPFNRDFIAHYPSPYTDPVPHLTVCFNFSEFTAENGGWLVVPGSHLRTTNPGYIPRAERFTVDPDETILTGGAGSVFVMNSRLWRAIARNPGDFPRASMVLDLAPAKNALPDFLAHARAPRMARATFDRLPIEVQPLFRDW